MLWLLFYKRFRQVKITSNFGKYNSKNYDTIFSENVIVIYPGHKITGEYLDFSFLRKSWLRLLKMLFILEIRYKFIC